MGLMLLPDPARAAAELARVLRPGGRAAVAVWGPREANPWLGRPAGRGRRRARRRGPAAGGARPLQPGRLRAGWRTSCATRASRRSRSTRSSCRSARPRPRTWWAVVPSLAGPLAQLLSALPPADGAGHPRPGGRRRSRPSRRRSGEVVATGRALVASGSPGRLARAARPARRRARACGRDGPSGQPHARVRAQQRAGRRHEQALSVEGDGADEVGRHIEQGVEASRRGRSGRPAPPVPARPRPRPRRRRPGRRGPRRRGRARRCGARPRARRRRRSRPRRSR